MLFGAGGGLTLPALASLTMSGATQTDAGLASGLFNTTQQIGAALGVAVLSTLAAARSASLHAAGLGSASTLTSGYRLAFATGAGLTLAALVVSAILLRNSASGTPGQLPREGADDQTVRAAGRLAMSCGPEAG